MDGSIGGLLSKLAIVQPSAGSLLGIMRKDDELTSPTVAKARGEYVRTHFKNMREVAAAISGMFIILRNYLSAIGV